MPEPSRHIGDHEFAGEVHFTGDVALPDNSIDEDAFETGSVLPHTILTHRLPIAHVQPSTDTVVAQSHIIHAAYRDATILGVEIAAYAVPVTTGSTDAYSCSVDILKSTGGSTGATILTAPIAISSTESDRVPIAGTLSGTPTLSDGDLLIRKVTVSGTTGTQAKGLFSEVTIAQDPVN